jgi:hypothetical protein
MDHLEEETGAVMTVTTVLLFAAVLLLAWFIYNQKIKTGVTATETAYTEQNVLRYDNVRDL